MSKRSEKQRQRARRGRRRAEWAARPSTIKIADLPATEPHFPGIHAHIEFEQGPPIRGPIDAGWPMVATTFEDWINSLEELPGPPPIEGPLDVRHFSGESPGGPMITVKFEAEGK